MPVCTPDAAHKHAVTSAGLKGYSYDANGNMVTRGTDGGDQTLIWDVENRPVTVSQGGGVIATFVYDGDGNRVMKTEGGEAIVYVNRYYEVNVTTATATSYYYLGGKLVALKEGDNLRYVHQDHLGSTSLMTDENGQQVDTTVTYKPYGETLAGDVPTDIKFTGQRLDDTGLYFYNARYYDAALGRFVSADAYVQWSAGFNAVSSPLTVNAISAGLGSVNGPGRNYPSFTFQAPVNPQNLNRYSYVINNPHKYTDPFGWWTLGIGLAGSAWAFWGVSGHVMLVFDGHGNWGIIVSGGGGGFGGSTGASGGVQVQATSADNIYQLTGTSVQTGASVGFPAGPVPVSLAGEFVAGKGYMGGQATAGIGTPGLEMHGVVEQATILVSGVLPFVSESNDKSSLGFLTSASALDILAKLTDAATYDMIIDISYESVASNLGEGQFVGWSSDRGYYVIG